MRTMSVMICALTAVLCCLPAGAAKESAPVVFEAQMQTQLLASFAALKGHIEGKASLNDKQIEAHKLRIDKYREIIGYNVPVNRR